MHTRLRRAHADIAAAVPSGRSGQAELAARLAAAVAPVVPHGGYCLIWFDPVTGRRGAHASLRGVPDAAPLVDNEALHGDLFRFAGLGASGSPVGVLGTGAPGERSSRRLHEMLRPAGFGGEARVALRSDGRLWAAFVLLRDAPFTAREAAALEELSGVLAGAARRQPVAAPMPPAQRPPGVAIVGSGNTIESVTAGAREWMDDLRPPVAGNDTSLPMAVRSAVHAARRAPDRRVLCRTRTPAGYWLSLRAELIEDTVAARPAATRVAVTLQTATAPDLLPAMVAWHGLTDREAQVVRPLLDGLPVKQIARRLGVSAYTVNDHLKSIYRKTAAEGRQHLAAVLGGLA